MKAMETMTKEQFMGFIDFCLDHMKEFDGCVPCEYESDDGQVFDTYDCIQDIEEYFNDLSSREAFYRSDHEQRQLRLWNDLNGI